MTTFWTPGPQYPGSEEEASPALMTMRKQSSADRRARAGPAAGAELFDGETMWVEHFLHNHNGKGQREGKTKTRDEKEEKEKSIKLMSLPETFSSATWLCNLTWRLCSCCLNYSHRNKLLPHNAMVSTKHPYQPNGYYNASIFIPPFCNTLLASSNNQFQIFCKNPI